MSPSRRGANEVSNQNNIHKRLNPVLKYLEMARMLIFDIITCHVGFLPFITLLCMGRCIAKIFLPLLL